MKDPRLNVLVKMIQDNLKISYALTKKKKIVEAKSFLDSARTLMHEIIEDSSLTRTISEEELNELMEAAS